MPLLSKRALLIAIPIWIVLGAYIYFVPVHNIYEIQKHQYDCKSKADFLQLENGTIIPCHNHPTSEFFKGIKTSFNSTNP